MEFDPATLAATPRNWLETRAHYEGAARAEFTNPPGAIEGPASVCVNSAGSCRVRIKIEKIDAPDEKNFALRSGSAPLGTYFVNGMSNPCRSLTVKSEAGVFTGGDRIIHNGMPFRMRPDIELPAPVPFQQYALVLSPPPPGTGRLAVLTWLCRSMNPAVTTSPVTSASARPGPRPGPISATRSPASATSAVASRPDSGSITRPPRSTMSQSLTCRTVSQAPAAPQRPVVTPSSRSSMRRPPGLMSSTTPSPRSGRR